MLKLLNLKKSYNMGTLREISAVNNVSLQLDKNEFVILVGENGSGKSTLLDLITGRQSVDDGQIFLNNKNVTGKPSYKRAKWITRIYQSRRSGLPGSLRVREVIRLALEAIENENKSNKSLNGFIKRSLNNIRPQLSRLVDEQIWNLSGGEHQLINIALTSLLVNKNTNKSHILLLDEHVSQLDPLSFDLVIDATNKLASKEGISTIMATHDFHLATKFGNRQIMLHKGRIIHDLKGKHFIKSPDSLIKLLSESNKETN